MLLFVGLGNPTPDSENNRHNVGFKIIDSINKKFRLSKSIAMKSNQVSYISDLNLDLKNLTANLGIFLIEKKDGS